MDRDSTDQTKAPPAPRRGPEPDLPPQDLTAADVDPASTSAEEDDEALFNLLRDARPFPDDQLPGTGVPIEWERALSPAFVRMPTYGTRASTVLRLGRGRVSMAEQRFDAAGAAGRSAFQFPVG